MNDKPNFRSLMQRGNLTEADLPEWLRNMVTCHEEAATALWGEPMPRQRELRPILSGSDAVISAHIGRIIDERKPASKIDKLKMMKIKAMAVEMLLKQP